MEWRRRSSLMLCCLWVLGALVKFEGLGCLGCLEKERIALLNIKAAFNNPNGSYFTSWEKESDCCVWERVKCNNNSMRRVISLSLKNIRGYQLPGWYLNASLFLPFEELIGLDLSNNSLLGWMENEGFGKLSRVNKLRVLVLDGNFFTSLTSLGELSSLKSLHLKGNELQGAIPIQEFNSFRKLEILDLGYNNFNGSLPIQEFTTLSKLRLLGLDHNNFSGSIPSFIGNLTSLQMLYLSHNKLNGSLPTQGLCKLKILQVLDLGYNGLEGNLSTCLGNLTSLRLMDVSHNQLEGEIPSSLILGLTSLQFLSLSKNRFEGLISLGLFANNSKLEYFSLTNGNDQLEVETEYPPWIPQFQLKFLRLSNCNLRNPIGSIPSFLYNQYNLRQVFLSENNLKGKFPSWILGNNTRLEALDLSYNSFIGPLDLPSNSNNTNIRLLDISYNQIHTKLPSNIGEILPNLHFLNLAENSLQGSLPQSLGDMRSLLALDLSKNKLSGKVPNWIGNLSNLRSLVMPKNYFEGHIPIGFCKLNKLHFLDLSQNNLDGTIPSFTNLSSLKYLHLQKNGFTGPLSNVWTLNSSMLSIDMRENNLFGSIPNWINTLSNLRILLLRGNLLQGPIPVELCQLVKLGIMDLSQNKLSGSIPSCLSNVSFGKARSIDDVFSPDNYIETLYSAQLTFHILDTIIRLTNLYSISGVQEEVEFITKSRSESYHGNILYFMSGMDLSWNRLTGHIPSEIGNLSEIHSLNLSHNYLTGSIPESFSNLKQVESLDLSHNRLSGTIPPQLTDLTFLSVFTVAHNNLSGMTPGTKNQFETFNETSYEGNSFLCGPPLQKSCNTTGTQSLVPTPSKAGENDTSSNFYMSFAISYIVGLLGYFALLYFNPRWREMWFGYIDACIASFHHRIT